MEKKKKTNYDENFDEFSSKSSSGSKPGKKPEQRNSIDHKSVENSTVLSNQAKNALLGGEKNQVKETGSNNKVVSSNKEGQKEVQRTPENPNVKSNQTYTKAIGPRQG